MVFLGAEAADGSRNPVGAVGVDGEAVQRPYQQTGDDQPLGGLEGFHEGPSYARVVWGCELDGAVDDVKDKQGEAVRQPAVLAADIERYGDGKNDGQKKNRAKDDVQEPPHRRVVGGGCCRAERARRLARVGYVGDVFSFTGSCSF